MIHVCKQHPKISETASASCRHTACFSFRSHRFQIVQSNKHESWTPQIVPRVCTRQPTQSAMVKGKACHATMGEMEIPQTLKGRVGMRNLGTPIYIQSLKLTARIWKRCNFWRENHVQPLLSGAMAVWGSVYFWQGEELYCLKGVANNKNFHLHMAQLVSTAKKKDLPFTHF